MGRVVTDVRRVAHNLSDPKPRCEAHLPALIGRCEFEPAVPDRASRSPARLQDEGPGEPPRLPGRRCVREFGMGRI